MPSTRRKSSRPATSWLSAFQDADFKDLCDIIKKPDLFSSYKSHKERVGGPAQMDIYKAIEDWAADKTRSRSGADPEGGRHPGGAGDERQRGL